MVGDSIAAGMGQQWPGAPAVVADPGARSGLVVTQVAPALAAAPGRPLVVVALGTNDDPRQVEAFRADVRALLGSAPGCVVWATVHRPGGRWEPLNAVLRGESARSGGRLQLADWDAFATANPQVLQADGIHPRTGTVTGRSSGWPAPPPPAVAETNLVERRVSLDSERHPTLVERSRDTPGRRSAAIRSAGRTRADTCGVGTDSVRSVASRTGSA